MHSLIVPFAFQFSRNLVPSQSEGALNRNPKDSAGLSALPEAKPSELEMKIWMDLRAPDLLSLTASAQQIGSSGVKVRRGKRLCRWVNEP